MMNETISLIGGIVFAVLSLGCFCMFLLAPLKPSKPTESNWMSVDDIRKAHGYSAEEDGESIKITSDSPLFPGVTEPSSVLNVETAVEEVDADRLIIGVPKTLLYVGHGEPPMFGVTDSQAYEMLRLTANGEVLVTMDMEGKVTIHKDGSAPEAAQLFWDSLEDCARRSEWFQEWRTNDD